MAEATTNSGTGIDQTQITDPIPPETPPTAADAKNADAPPASDADAQNPEDTPEQLEEKRESRRARSNARKAAALATAQTEARMLREQLAREEARRTPSAPAAEPQREEFDSLEDYHRALARHEAKVEATKAIEAERKAVNERETKARTADADRRVADEWTKGEEAFRKEAKDYDEVVGEFIEGELSDLDAGARRAILKSGPSILYHLAKNPVEAERISRLDPDEQIMEIGRMKDKVTPAKRTSSAPPPVSRVNGRSNVVGYREDMSNSEFKAWSKANGAKWAQ